MATPPTGNPVGRPSKYKPEYCELLIQHCSEGFSYESFGGRVGVSAQTVYQWEKSYPEFLDAKKVGRAAVRYTLEQIGHQFAAGSLPPNANATAWIFMMKNICGWKNEPHVIEDDGIDELEFVDDGDVVEVVE